MLVSFTVWFVIFNANAADKNDGKSLNALRSADIHAEYYYPDPRSTENYIAQTAMLTQINYRQRIQFVTDFMNQMVVKNHYPPQFAIFTQGDNAKKMIITSLGADRYDTVYRMRGLIEILTARARVSEFFQRYDVADVLTFLDLLKLLGFEQLVVTDGDKFAHRIVIE